MNSDAPTRLAKTGMALDIALIAVALPFIFLTDYRSTQLKMAISILFMLHCGVSTYLSWKAGMLSKTFGQIYDKIRESGPPKRRRFESLALFISFTALFISIWS